MSISLPLNPTPRLVEQYEILKCRILSGLNGNARGPLVLAFTSCESGEGVTTVSANFAATMAAEGDRRVLLMDGDLRRPSLEALFGRAKIKALVQEESGGDEAAPSNGAAGGELSRPAWRMYAARENLDVLVARRSVDNPSRVFAMEEFGKFIKHARSKYDVVVVDCPPIHGSSGATILSAKADATVLVVEAGRVRHEVIQRAVVLLEDTGANVVGAVLNKRRYPVPKILYKMI